MMRVCRREGENLLYSTFFDREFEVVNGCKELRRRRGKKLGTSFCVGSC